MSTLGSIFGVGDPPGARAVLIVGTRDPAPEVRRSAVAALRSSRDETVTDLLVACADDTDRWVRYQAAGPCPAGRARQSAPRSNVSRRTRTATFATRRTLLWKSWPSRGRPGSRRSSRLARSASTPAHIRLILLRSIVVSAVLQRPRRRCPTQRSARNSQSVVESSRGDRRPSRSSHRRQPDNSHT
ncbi:HEAT repeat domain-containing protein [Streptomyces sp. NPDC055722]